ncbi:sucrase ferredoxin [Merismopedia glauca]|uniref:Sucrase ferredoxin n=1 Tax=Merismopedia glauca CCAP 1448/3 TaxID=1296344 RepID=A0A2T1BZP0_9CYAN|nr:sucrase ferredoxin [Merismopedia glauca]PSB01378.1 sucrase ferredoxin [Merismopedia glauca CCAP 1448/3]
MPETFCAAESLLNKEPIIGNGLDYRLYFLIEVAPPWSPNEFESKSIPENLRSLVEGMTNEDEDPEVQFLLIYNRELASGLTRLIIYERELGLSKGYLKQELNFILLEDIAPFVINYLAKNDRDKELQTSETRDILVCTHGSQDICCARYGNPFFKDALAVVSELGLSEVRVWQVSHIGGHRFAPTAIAFPDGRYYGRLDRDSLRAILTRSGDLDLLKRVYRGWAILPQPAQILEVELISIHGWDWFNYKVDSPIINGNEDGSFNDVEITYEVPNGDRYKYRAEVVVDASQTIYLKGSCDSQDLYPFPTYEVRNMHQIDLVAGG